MLPMQQRLSERAGRVLHSRGMRFSLMALMSGTAHDSPNRHLPQNWRMDGTAAVTPGAIGHRLNTEALAYLSCQCGQLATHVFVGQHARHGMVGVSGLIIWFGGPGMQMGSDITAAFVVELLEICAAGAILDDRGSNLVTRPNPETIKDSLQPG